MSNQYINYTVEERIATVTINNPPVNALSAPVVAELGKVFDEIKADPNVKVVIITGAGRFFVAGADIKEIVTIASAEQAVEMTTKAHRIFGTIESLGKPVIAAINGACLGGGLELAMTCHIRIAGERARLGQPEINLGIIPGFGGTQRLPRIVGTAKAIELIFTGDMISALEAKDLGLVNKVVPDGEVLKEAKDLAKKITGKGFVAVATALKAIEEGCKVSLEDGLALESRLFGQICETEDMKEGLNAFIEKRQPKFKDK